MANTIDAQSQAVLALAESALSSARQQASRIGFSSIGISDASLTYTVNEPNLSPPPQFSDLFPGADTSNEMVQWLNSEADKWIEKYFPELAACLRTLPEEWLCGILSGEKEFGLDKTVFEILWQRARDRAYRTNASEAATIRADFSTRGFEMPPGAFFQAITEAEQRAGIAIGEVNREQMVKEAEIKLDLLKFAEEQAIRLKLGIMDAMRSFYVAWISIPDKSLEKARIQSQAMATFYSALASYYNVELGFEELRLRAAEAKAGVQIDNNRVKVANTDGGRNAALGVATQAFANTASGAASAGSALFANITTGG